MKTRSRSCCVGTRRFRPTVAPPEDVDIDGMAIAAGEQFVTLLARPTVTPRSRRATVDVGRVGQAPMSFGGGIHTLGAAGSARGAVVFDFARSLPGNRAGVGRRRYTETMTCARSQSLPVRFAQNAARSSG
jgi:hypothetical protein